MTQELVERAMHGDQEAFGILAQERLSRLVGAAGLILRDAAAAEDAVQETLVQAWRDLPSLRSPDRFDAWLRRILIRRCDDLMRQSPDIKGSVVEEVAGPWSEPGFTEHEDLSAGITRLSDEHREVLVLRYYLDLSQEEIASALGVRLGTVKSRLHRALAYLRAELASAERVSSRGLQ
jgi:RNA polymerase sigma-70 factor (ECF subfamily)